MDPTENMSKPLKNTSSGVFGNFILQKIRQIVMQRLLLRFDGFFFQMIFAIFFVKSKLSTAKMC